MGAQHAHAVGVEAAPRGVRQGLQDAGAVQQAVDDRGRLERLEGAAHLVQDAEGVGDRPGDRLARCVDGLLRHPPSAPGRAEPQQVDVGAAEQGALQREPQVELARVVVDDGERGEQPEHDGALEHQARIAGAVRHAGIVQGVEERGDTGAGGVEDGDVAEGGRLRVLAGVVLLRLGDEPAVADGPGDLLRDQPWLETRWSRLRRSPAIRPRWVAARDPGGRSRRARGSRLSGR